MDQSSITPTGTTAQSPAASSSTGSVIGDLLKTLGVGQSHVNDVHEQTTKGDVSKQIDQAHSYITDALNHARESAAKNPGAVLGGISALVIAAGMLRNHTSNR